MELRGKIIDLSLDYVTHKPKLTLKLDRQDNLAEYDDLKDVEDLDIKITKHREKRSLNANAYCWTIIGKIAEEIGATKEDVYKKFIKDKGVYRVITIDKKAADTFIKLWTDKGLGWLCEKSSQTKTMVDIVAYYGTSSYNTKQMANFINYVVEEATNLKIPTIPDKELERLINEWQGTE